MARKKDDRPTLSELKQWRDSLKALWSSGRGGGLLQRQDDEEDIYFQMFPLVHTQDDQPVRVGSAPADVDSAIDNLVPKDITVRVEPAMDKKKYERQAELLVRGGRAFMRLWRQHRDVIREIATDQCLRSVGVGRVLYDDTLWPTPGDDVDLEDPDALEEWEVNKRRQVPIILEYRNAKYVRWRLNRIGRPIIVVEDYPTNVLEARDAYGHLPAAARILRNLQGDQDVQVHDIWFEQWRCILINEEPIFPGTGVIPHGYPEIPYIFAPFRELNFESPGERYRGVLTNQATIYQAESQAVSLHMTMLRFNSWRAFKGWTRDNREIQIRPGFMTPIDQRFGEYLELMTGDPISPAVMQTASVLEGYRIQNGVGQSGLKNQENSRSAQQVMMLQALSDKKVSAARQALERLCADAIRLAMMIIQDVIKEPITLPSPGRDGKTGKWLGKVRIKPDDINGYWDRFECLFSKRVDPAQIEVAKALSALAQGNWMPYDVSVLLSGMTDTPSDWEDALQVQAAERQPFMLEAAVYELIKAFYEGDEESWMVDLYRARMAQQQAQQQGPPPGQQGPAVPSPGAQNPPAMMRDIGQIAAQQAVPRPLPHVRGKQGGIGGTGRPPRGGGPQV